MSYKLKQSVFDLVLLAFLKVIVHAQAVVALESVTLKLIGSPHNGSLHAVSKLLHILNLFLSFASLAFSTTKGGLVLYAILHEKDYVHMHATYNALLISAVAFSLIEFGVFSYSIKAMKNLKVSNVS